MYEVRKDVIVPFIRTADAVISRRSLESTTNQHSTLQASWLEVVILLENHLIHVHILFGVKSNIHLTR